MVDLATPLTDTRSLPGGPPPLPSPRIRQPVIGLIGCGNIAESHLDAYRAAGWRVGALCDMRLDLAQARGRAFCPEARIVQDYRELLDDPEIEVVDLALHPEHRSAPMAEALQAGKHVLSQKPFVLDLDEGRRLITLARENGVEIAVNQNARWAPYVRYLHALTSGGHLGRLRTASFHLNWDHTWIRGTDFARIPHLLLYDFAIHWIDMARLFFGCQRARRVFATIVKTGDADDLPPLAGSIAIEFANSVASFVFDGYGSPDGRESITLTGERGLARAQGPLHAAHTIEVFAGGQHIEPELEGHWYRDGFRGAMGELLRAIEESRPPQHSAADNLDTLEVLFAAIQSADTGMACVPGSVTRVPASCCMRPMT